MASLRARRSGLGPPTQARAPVDAGQDSNRPSGGPSSAGGERLGWLVLVVTLVTLIYYQSFWLPTPLSAEQAGRLGFSEERAFSHLKVLTSFGPRPVGSESLDHALEYIVNAVKDIQRKANPSVYIEIDQFHSKPGANRLQGGLFRGKTLAYADLRNILVRLSSKHAPEADENSILVSSHVDTVYTSEGGGDCGSCVSVMLELIRALSNVAQNFKHSVVFLFNTGEEEGLNGAHSFVTQHPWKASVRTAIDLEALGAGGKSHIFQAPNNWLLDIFAQVAKYPSAQVGAQDVFHSGFIKSATDFQIYTELGGWSGLDFAYMENGAVYHTRNDALRLVRPGSLQHSGDNLLPLLKEVSRSSELPHVKTLNSSTAFDAVYFDILGRIMVTINKPLARSLYLSTLIQALLLLAGSFIRAPAFSLKAMAYGILALSFTWLLALASTVFMAVLVTYVTAASVPYVAYPLLTIGLFASPALFGAVLGHSVGHSLLYRYLVRCQAPSPQADAERTMFKSSFLQWLFILALTTWAGAGSSYVPFTWLVAPAVAYGVFESSFANRPPSTLSMWTLVLGLPLPIALSAGLFTILPSSLIGNLVRIQDDTALDMVMEAMEIDANGEPRKAFSFNLLQLIKAAQAQHGLRHNDHNRYRKYCTDRLRRLYKSLKFTHGRGKFVKKTLNVSVVNDVRHLHIALYSAERAWSYAMSIKDTADGMSGQQRYHLLRRMRKACKWAELLETLCKEKADVKTAVEAAAYASFMRGYLYFETRNSWKIALKKFQAARSVYEELGKYGDVENQLLCRERVEEIEPNVRYCKLMIEQGNVDRDTKEPMEEEDDLQEKLKSVVSEARVQVSAATTGLEWLGRKYPVENNKTRAYVLKAQVLENDMLKPSLASDKKVGVYDKLSVLYQEARKHIRDDLNTAGNTEDVRDQLTALDKAVSCIIYSRAIQRADAFTSICKDRFKRQQQDAKYTESLGTIRDIVAQYDTMINNITELEELATSGREVRPEESALASELNVKRLVSRAERCFYLAYSYLNAGQHSSAYALFKRAQEYTQQALQSQPKRDEAFEKEIQELVQQCRKQSCLAHAKGVMESIKGQENLETGISTLSIADGYLMDHLDVYKSALVGTTNKQCRISQVPPAFKTFPHRPVFLDPAGNAIDFPSLDARLKKMKDEKKKTGFLGRWW